MRNNYCWDCFIHNEGVGNVEFWTTDAKGVPPRRPTHKAIPKCSNFQLSQMLPWKEKVLRVYSVHTWIQSMLTSISYMSATSGTCLSGSVQYACQYHDHHQYHDHQVHAFNGRTVHCVQHPWRPHNTSHYRSMHHHHHHLLIALNPLKRYMFRSRCQIALLDVL